MTRRFLCRAALPLTLAALPPGMVAGCGGANNPSSLAQSAGGNSPVAPVTSPFASRSFTSTLALGTDRNGTLALSVAADGTTATGTLTVAATTRAAAATRQAQNFNFAYGTYTVSGTVDPTTGAFQLTGSIGGEAFTMQGVLPTATTGDGSYTLTAGGETYTGTFAAPNTSTPVPTNPTPTAPTPGNGLVSFSVVSRSADCNLDESLISNLGLVASKYTPASAVPVAGYNAYGLTTTSKQQVGQNSGTFALGYAYTAGGVITPAKFQFTEENGYGDTFNYKPLTLLETAEVSGLSITLKQWRPTGGNLIVSVSGKTITLRGENVVFTPVTESAIGFLKSAGTFTANFTITLNNVDGL